MDIQGSGIQDHDLVDEQAAAVLAGADQAQSDQPADPSGDDQQTLADLESSLGVSKPGPGVTPADNTPTEAPESVIAMPEEADTSSGNNNPVIPTPTDTPDEPAADDNATSNDQVDEPTIAVPAPTVDNVAPEDLGTGDDGELLGVKQQALDELTPLVGRLQISNEEKFDTYMMIIRASDDKGVVKPAFDAAQSIEDPDKKAQALLDVINEINYLTQPKND